MLHIKNNFEIMLPSLTIIYCLTAKPEVQPVGHGRRVWENSGEHEHNIGWAEDNGGARESCRGTGTTSTDTGE